MIETAAMASALLGDATRYGAGEHWNEAILGQKANEVLREEFQKRNPFARQLPNKIMSKRLVRVFLVDPNENVPVLESVLYQSPEKLTDLTDQELYFEMPVQQLLNEFNIRRVTFLDKKASATRGKDVFLEPARIRDLQMTVLNIASF